MRVKVDGGERTPRLRELRRGAAMSQRELARASGIAASTIAYLEEGSRGAQWRTIRRLAQVLGVSPGMLVAGGSEAVQR